MLNYDPIVPSHGNVRMHTIDPTWQDPRKLVADVMGGLNEANGGTVKYQVAEWRDINGFFPFQDGFKYTADGYIKIYDDYVKSHGGDSYGYWSSPAWHGPDLTADYESIISENRFIPDINSGKFDEVFLLAPPMTGFYESRMVGPGAVFCNSPPITGTPASRLSQRNFIIQTVGWERDVGMQFENVGHRSEFILENVFNSHSHALSGINHWKELTRNMTDGNAVCGNVHFAPNSVADYDWGNPTPVWSSCDDWLNFPRLTGAKKLMTAADWGGGDIAKHHRWWFRHFPKAAGFDPDGMLFNWWGYVSVFLTGV